jgi:hypothetical protein
MTYKIKVDGVEREVTLEELTQLAEKASGADKRFQEAAGDRRMAARIKELTAKANNSELNESEFKELGGLMGYSDEHVNKTWEMSLSMQNEVEEEDEPAPVRKAPVVGKAPDAALVALQNQNAELQRQLEGLNQKFFQLETHTMQDVQKNISGEIENLVAKHPKFSTMSVKQRNLLIDNFVRPELSRIVTAGEPYGPVTLNKVLDKTTSFAQDIGLITSTEQDAEKKSTQLTGLLGAGGFSGTNSIVQAMKEGKTLERPKVTDGKFGDYVAARMLQESEAVSSKSNQPANL